MPQFRDEHIIIIAPGSWTTLAQLGLPESFTPARLRLPTRMFPGETDGEWEPQKVRRKQHTPVVTATADPASNGTLHTTTDEKDKEEPTYEEDPLSDAGAAWPIRRGRIVNWPCFFALLSHIHNTLSPPLHTPILIITDPSWTAREQERIAQFVFEKFKPPGLSLLDAAQATCYAFSLPTACVIDVGADKADVTAVVDFIVDEAARGVAIPDCGGEALTQRLLELLRAKNFTREMCEQLKKSPICEILPPGVSLPKTRASTKDQTITTASTNGSSQKEAMQKGDRVVVPSEGSANYEPEVHEQKEVEDNDGVLDVASIVAGGKMPEFLARKEKEKTEKAATKKKSGDATAATAKPIKLKNSEREKNTFLFEDFALLEALRGSNMTESVLAGARATLDEGPQAPDTDGRQSSLAIAGHATNGTASDGSLSRTAASAPRREISVGTERFQAATGNMLFQLTSAIHRCILSVPSPSRRSELWESLIIVGNGSAVRGFKESIIALLQARFQISPSGATMFTSELPSNLSTPLATGANTPIPRAQSQIHGSGVNPLLLAATTASAQGQMQGAPGQYQSGQNVLQPQHLYSSHSQTPNNIKVARLPEYFPEWKDVGSDEAMFLGAQVAAKVIFVTDSGTVGKGYMSRSDYNEQGPTGIHDYTI